MIKIGFTGTREGITECQQEETRKVLDMFLHHGLTGVHGGCVGADAEFHAICKSMDIRTEVWPGYPVGNPSGTKFRAELEADETHEPMEFLARNRKIVGVSAWLIACPKDDSGKGGTWYTIRYARKQGRIVTVIQPQP